ncbi:MAG: hypothetical protein HAW60_05975 [Bdellovibrionales bacterium]|nr:hypothetical protein [Bdellovibrionales bacterium]
MTKEINLLKKLFKNREYELNTENKTLLVTIIQDEDDSDYTQASESVRYIFKDYNIKEIHPQNDTKVLYEFSNYN